MKTWFAALALVFICCAFKAYAHCGNDCLGGPSGGGSPSPSPSCSPPPPSGQSGANKFSAFSGNVHREIVDLEMFSGIGEEKLAFKRITTSRYKPAIPTPLGTGGSWRHSYYWNIVPNGTDQATGNEIIHVDYPDGTEFDFHKETASSIYLTGVSATHERIEQSSTDLNQYYLWFADGRRVSFRKQVSGGATTFQVQGLYDRYNNFYTFTLDSKNRVTRVTEPGGRYIQINYGSIGNFNVVNANFSYTNSTATTVSVAGEFNGWNSNANPMTNNNGTWTASVPVQPNTSYQYKFVVNGNWVPDPNNPNTFPAGGPSTGNNSVMSAITNQDLGTTSSPVPITFSYTNASASTVSVAGQFNNWSATGNPLTRSGSTWTTTINISPGTYQYKFVVNGSSWIIDPGNPFTKPDGYGGYNSNLVVGPLDEGILQVVGSDGRSVTYNYAMFTVGGSIYSMLTRANYSDGTAAQYSYLTPTIGSRPNLGSANDPRYKGGISRVAYTYQSNGIEGFISQEKSLVDGTVIASIAPSENELRTVTTGGSTIQMNFSGGQLASITDSLGRVRSYGYFNGGWGMQSAYNDPNGSVSYQLTAQFGNESQITFPDGKSRVTTYTSDTKPFFQATTTDENGKVTAYTRDSNGRPTRIDYPDQSYETFTYDNNNFGLLLSHRMRNGATESLTYYASGDTGGKLGDLKTKTDGAGSVTTFTYDAAGRVQSRKDGRNNVTSFQYNERGQLVSRTNADGTTRTYSYDTYGSGTLVTNELGKSWTYTYDQYNRLTSVTDPLNRATQYAYGLPNGGCTASCSAENKPISVTLPSGKRTSIAYDTEWQKISETVGSGSSDAATTTYGYDALGNLITITDPRGKIWGYSYNNRNRKTRATDPNGNYTDWTYDGVGNVLTEKRLGDANSITYIYDGANHRIDITDQAGNNTHMTYDGAGNMLTLRDARQNTYMFTYDGANRRTALAYPAGGGTEAWTYDAAGNLGTYTTRVGQIETFTYDNRNRETNATWSGNVAPTVSRTYDAVGRLLTLTNSVSTLSYTYDNANQLVSETQQIVADGGPKSVIYSYDADGNRATVGYPSGSSVTYAYTNRNQTTNVTSGSISAGYTYDLGGNRTAKNLSNSTNVSYAYDNASRLLSIDNQKAGVSFGKSDYIYNALNNRVSRAETVAGTSKTDNYGYDAIDQVIQVKYNFNAGANTQDRLVGYNYDPVGNRSGSNGVSDSLNGSTNYIANNLNQYTAVGSLTPTYDGNGNLNGQDGWSYTYDALNRLTNASNGTTSIVFTYDGRNRRVSRTINGTVTFLYYDGWNLIEEQNVANVLLARYIHGVRTDEVVANIAMGSTTYYHHDALGSTTALTDTSGNVVERYTYDVFGAPTTLNAAGANIGNSAFGNSFLFTGREYIQQAAIYDYRNRVYSPQFGRFLQSDPLRFDARDVNLYRYVANNVANRSDPMGLEGPPPIPTPPPYAPPGPPGPIPGPPPAPPTWPPPPPPYPGALPQDGICSSPASALNAIPSAQRCCKQHDDCYAAHGCQSNSWTRPGCWPECDKCNAKVAACVAQALGNPPWSWF